MYQQEISVSFMSSEHHGLLLNIEVQKWMDDVLFINHLINCKTFDKTRTKHEMCFTRLYRFCARHFHSNKHLTKETSYAYRNKCRSSLAHNEIVHSKQKLK
jgi:hypothetical protein